MASELSRRYFLRVIAAGAATSTGVLAACSGSNAAQAEAFGDVTAGNVSALGVNQLKPVPGAPVFVGRDANGVYAMTTTCTHQGCDLATGMMTSSYVACPCHSSRFDYNGNVLTGPATQSLVHFKVDVAADGTITIHGATEVDATTRVAVG